VYEFNTSRRVANHGGDIVPIGRCECVGLGKSTWE